MANSIINERALYELDKYVLNAGSVLIRQMCDIFTVDNWISPDQFEIKEIDWDRILKKEMLTPDVMELINYLPECVPFKVRALVFSNKVAE